MHKKRSSAISIIDVVTEQYNGQKTVYVVNFHGGGWVMVSADDSTVPVLSYSHEGQYNANDPKPDAFMELVGGYKKQIDSVKRAKVKNNEIIEKWNELVTNKQEFSITLKTYTTGSQLLNVRGRGHVRWSQSTNNSGTCTPAYNASAPPEGGTIGWFYDCDCGRAPIGCSAVAMGQVMWYWQWPNISSWGNNIYKTYNWNLMPDILTNGMTAQGAEIANLLRDCGVANGTVYACNGSFATMNNIENALRNNFNFKAARMVVKNDWKSSVWTDLIRAEIDSERPVIYRGDKSDLSTDKHIFVIDGYDASDADFFWINFGWGNSSYNLSRHYLGDISPGDHDFNKNQSAIIGISPTYYSPSRANIIDVSYSMVSNTKMEDAQQNITLPASGKRLSIENGGNLTLVAGNSITLRPGFHAKQGSILSAKIDPSYNISGNMEITVPGWPNAMDPNSGGLWLLVNNANSFDFVAMNRYGQMVYQRAGTISGNRVDLWDGLNQPEAVYACRVRLRNNFGRIIDKTWDVTIIYRKAKSAMANDSAGINYNIHLEEQLSTNNNSSNLMIAEADVTIYPNPNSGKVNINIQRIQSSYNVKVYSAAGTLVYQDIKITKPIYTFDISNFANGVYMVQVEIDERIITKKLILSK